MMEGGIPGGGAIERRRTRRRRVLKRAKLVLGLAGSTIDCLVLDETPFGVQLETPVMTHLPESLRIRFSGGPTYNAQQQWSAGTRLGLHYIGSPIYDDESQHQRNAIKLALKDQGLERALRLLRDAGFLQREDVREAAEAAEQALTRLNDLL